MTYEISGSAVELHPDPINTEVGEVQVGVEDGVGTRKGIDHMNI